MTSTGVRLGAQTGAVGTDTAPTLTPAEFPAAAFPAAAYPAAGTPAVGTPVAGTPMAGTPVASIPAAGIPVQGSFDELDEPLRCTTFVVVDLETTGGSAGQDGITEIGAVKVRGGEMLGEFQTLVDPERGITPFVSVLTGITDAMVIGAPTAARMLPAFLEFARGCVLVAHNAPFDIGFLKAACHAGDQAWPNFAVVDTAVLARRVLSSDEVPNCKLATLAGFFQATTTPNHRALADAQATVDVLHGLIDRLGRFGVESLPELRSFTAQVTVAQRRKRHLGDHLPDSPGVYVFRDARGNPLYVGTSRSLRRRVRQYFVASETRTRMGEMVGLAERVDGIVCAHPLEAQVRELRLIAAHKPRYNRRSKFPERAVWLKLTREAYPRLSIVREVRDDGASYLGPLRSQRQAEAVRDAIHHAVPLRQCTERLSLTRIIRAACALAGMNRCAAPCEHGIEVRDYQALSDAVAAAWCGDVTPLVDPLRDRLNSLTAQQRFEEAALVRDRMAAVVRACARMQRISALTGVSEIVAAHPDGDGGWELSVIRYGRLAAAGHAPRGVDPMPTIAALVDTADAVDPAPRSAPDDCARSPTRRPMPATPPIRSPTAGTCPSSPGQRGRRRERHNILRTTVLSGECCCPDARAVRTIAGGLSRQKDGPRRCAVTIAA